MNISEQIDTTYFAKYVYAGRVALVPESGNARLEST